MAFSRRSNGLIIALLLASSAHAASVRQFSPQGIVDQQTRATAVFDVDIVPLGQSEAAAPFTVDCGEVKGKGRWADARNWAYVLDRPLQAGERCDFSVRANLRTHKGESVSTASYAFFAPGPWPRSVTPRSGQPIEEDQAFVIDASAPLKRASVEANVWCEADGVGNRIPVRVLPDSTLKEILATLHRAVQPGSLAVSCSERLPAGAKARLVWGKGVEADLPNKTLRSTREERFNYTVREPFRASLSCERDKAGAPCSPLSDIRIEFSAAIDIKLAEKLRLMTPEGARSPLPRDQEGARQNTVREVVFSRPFAQNAGLTIEMPSDIKDESGRPLSNATSFPLNFKTSAMPPLAKFPGSFGIIELKEGGILPVTLRNVEASLPLRNLPMSPADAQSVTVKRMFDDAEVIATINALARFEQQTKRHKLGEGKDATIYDDPYYAREFSFLKGKPGVLSRELPKPGGSAEFEVLGIPLEKPGYHVVEIESRLLGSALLAAPAPMYVRTSVLVTNLAVHFKRGKENALVWVTALDSGKPVAGADLRISSCDGKMLWVGRTDDAGRALVQQAVSESSCKDASFLLVSARLGDDFSFVRSDWNEGIEPWRFGVETWGESSARRIHTIFDRSLLRAGQTVSMKHIARERKLSAFAIPDAGTLPKEMIIRHEGSNDEFRQPLSWDARGAATNQWKIPDSAKRGTYQVELSDGKNGSVYVGDFRVSDFRLPVFTGSVQGAAGRMVAPKEVPLALGLSFLNGGAAKGAKVEVSATLRPRWPEYKGFDDFRFLVDFEEQGRAAFGVDDGREREQLLADRLAVTLDQAGAGKLSVPLAQKIKGPSELYAEMSFADPNGEVQTLRGTVALSPAAVVAGIRVKDWVSVKENGAIEVVTLDTQGKVLTDVPVKVSAKRRVDYSHRKRVVGGFYAYDNRTEFVDLGTVCSGKTDARGKLACDVKSSEAGNVYLLVEAKDKEGNAHYAGTSYWVSGGGDLWFAAGNQDRIDVIPEKKSYAPGETARLQVRTPFREATALVTVEAGGIIDSKVMPLSRFKPTIELPVKGEWGPNVFVSVLVVRGRVEPLKWFSFFDWGWREPLAWFREWWNPTQPTAMVDLAKPAWRLGLGGFDVGVDAFRLKVDVTADKADYRPRDTAQVKIKVTQPDGKPAPAGSEVAFAAVDKALLELRLNESWNLLDAMLPRRAYEVETATAQSQVIGKRHFGRKAVPPGGGGGRAPARELFDTLLVWNPRVVLDAAGSATLSVPINDSLTEFKLVAVADADTGLFGTGSTALRTKQDLQLISGLPPLVRELDRFNALLTLRNGTTKPMTVNLTARAGERTLGTKEVKLDAEGAVEVMWPAEAPEGVNALVWEFEASAKESGAKDKLRITQQVAPAVPITVQQASFARVDGRLEIPAALPANALPAKGGIEVGLSAKLSTPPPGLRQFFLDYPFACIEQKTSVAIGLKDETRWQQVVEALPTYLDANGLVRYFPGEGAYGNAGNPVLTAYLLSVSHAAGLQLPPELVQRMERGLAAFVEGRIKPEIWSPQNDLVVRKLVALEALTRRGQRPLSAISSLEIEPLRLPTSALIDWMLVVKRTTNLPERETRLAAVDRELRNRLSYLGGRLSFTSERTDYWWWMMVSGDANAFRLIEAVVDDPAWKDDLPALVQGAMQRQQRGRWLTTVANVWATIALEKFGKQFERDTVSGSTKAALGNGAAQVFKWAGNEGESGRLMLNWPEKPTPADKLQLTQEGSGKPWAALQVMAAVPVKEAKAYGLRVTREVTPVQEKQAGKVSRGDVWRVRLSVESDQELSWVALNDAVPAGARLLGEGDGRDSHIATLGQRDGGGRAWPAYVERTFGNWRAYYAYVPRGKFFIDYTLRLNNAGEFVLPGTRVEAMYAPEVFGELPGGKVVVSE